MSFCSRVKLQVSKDGPTNGCCMRAETYGLLLFSHLLTTERHVFKTEHSCTAHLVAELTAVCCGAYVEIEEAINGNRKIYNVALPENDQRELVLRSFGITENDASAVDMGLIESECCREAFLRGVFLACGSISDPDKAYHMEFSAHNENLCRMLSEILHKCGVSCGVSSRRGGFCAYIKDGESIESALALIGAGNAYYELVNLRIFKNATNNANRKVNCDNANISKTVSAAMQQIASIKKIEQRCGLEHLSPDLRELAELRLENPEMTLRELGESLSEPLTRSGVNHRMQRLAEIAAQLDEGRE